MNCVSLLWCYLHICVEINRLVIDLSTAKVLFLSPIQIGAEIDDRCDNDDHRSRRHIRVIRQDQSQYAGKEREHHRKEMIFPHILRQIPACCRRKDQKRIDNQDTNPLN